MTDADLTRRMDDLLISCLRTEVAAAKVVVDALECIQRLTAERDALAAQLDALRGRIEALRDEFRRWVACNEPIAATGGWQASGYMKAYLNRAAVVLDAALAAAPSETEEGR